MNKVFIDTRGYPKVFVIALRWAELPLHAPPKATRSKFSALGAVAFC